MTGEHSGFFYTPASLIKEGRVVIAGADARHLRVVRRVRQDDTIHVSDGGGRVLHVRVAEITNQRVTGEILGEKILARPGPQLSVFQGLAKGGKVDLVVQKLVEIGVDEIVIFGAGRSVPNWEAARAARASQRWRTIAYEAAKQSRRPFLPRVSGPADVSSAVEMLTGLVLVAHGDSESRLSEVLPETAPERISLIVGPEGGLEQRELEAFGAPGSALFTLGPQVLRTETAALVAASLVLHRYGLLG